MYQENYDAGFSRIIEKTRRIDFSRYMGMPGPEFKMLQTIDALEKDPATEGKLRVSDLVRAMEIPAPLVSRTLKSMEEKGWIWRETDRNDRRSTLVLSTAEGREKKDEVCRRSQKLMDMVGERFGREKMATLEALFEEMLDVTADVLARCKEEEGCL